MASTNPTYKPSEGKREEFRKYLEKNGVMDALTKVLVHLYEETNKPEDAKEYIRERLAIIAGIETHKEITQKLLDAEKRIKSLEEQLESRSGDKDGITYDASNNTDSDEEHKSEKKSNESNPITTDEKPAAEVISTEPPPKPDQ